MIADAWQSYETQPFLILSQMVHWTSRLNNLIPIHLFKLYLFKYIYTPIETSSWQSFSFSTRLSRWYLAEPKTDVTRLLLDLTLLSIKFKIGNGLESKRNQWMENNQSQNFFLGLGTWDFLGMYEGLRPCGRRADT